MAIKSITRDWGFNPALVRIQSTDSYATITAPGYITAQKANIDLANMGDFEWQATDAVLCVYAGGWAFLSISPDFSSLNPLSLAQTVSVSLNAAAVLAAYATPQLLIPAPGAGKAIIVSELDLYTSVGTVFAGGGVGIVQYGATVHGAGVNTLSATIPAAEVTAAASQVYVLYGPPAVNPATAITNLGIYFSNATGAFTGGANSTLNFNLRYLTINALV